MGLDMFLASYDDWDEEKNDLKDDWNELLYWRKCNWLHKYFCDHGKSIQDDILYIISREDLTKLLHNITSILSAKNKVKVAKTKLPTQSGFFFGSTNYDEWYFEKLLSVLSEMSDLLLENKDNKFVYYASW